MAVTENSELLKELQRLLGRPDPVGFTRKGIAPGAFSYITRDDKLYIRARNSVTAAEVTISGRIHQPDGDIHEFSFVHTPNTDRTVSLESFDLGEGYLVGLAVHASAGTVRRGQCWVELGLLRGLTAADSVRQVLGRDYVTTDDAWGWPGAPNKSSLHGPGALRSITGTNPAVGIEITEVVPANVRWQIRSVRLIFVTDATVSNRQVSFNFDDGTNRYFSNLAASVQAASLSQSYSVSAAPSDRAVISGNHVIPIPPDSVLASGFRFVTATINLQAGDDFGAPQFTVEEWLEE